MHFSQLSIIPIMALLLFCNNSLQSQGDLYVDNFSVFPTSVQAGGTVQIQGDITYTGGFPYQMVATFEVYLKYQGEELYPSHSRDQVANYGFSGGATTFDLDYTLQIPSNLRNGWYELRLYTDAQNESEETDETNNLNSQWIYVSGSNRPSATCNLYPIYTWVEGSTACINESRFRCGGRIANRPSNNSNNNAPVTQAAPSTLQFMYLSTDYYYSPDDYLVGDVRMNSIQAGALDGPQQLANPFMAQMPYDITAGYYYMMWFVDAFDEAIETDETDNMTRKLVMVQQCGRSNADDVSSETFEIFILDELSLSIYPNPASNIVQVKYPRESIDAIRLMLTDNSGRIIDEQNIEPRSQVGLAEFKIDHLPNGVYFVVYQSGKNKEVRKLIKQ